MITSSALKQILDQMTLQEKIGQLVISFFWAKKMSSDLKEFLSETKIGNVIYFTWANELSSPEQIRSLSQEVQDVILETTKIPALITVDQEGGIVTRLQNGFTSFPGNMALSATQDPSLAYEMGKTMGRELLSVGVNCNLAPVVDMQDPLLRPWYIGVRTYGDDPSQAISFTQKKIQGMQEENLLYVLKHAPGLGSVSVNPHLALPINIKTQQELESQEFIPFRSFLDAPAMMTGHVVYPALDLENPASLSQKITTQLIRNTWGYKGVIITDSLSMNAVLENTSSLELAISSLKNAATKALLAGADLLILGRARRKQGECFGCDFTR